MTPVGGYNPRRDTSPTDASSTYGKVAEGGIDSTGASDGDVLTADGAGGAAWEPPASGGGGVTDHGALTGLGDDDHTQYMLNGSGASNGIVPVYADTTGRNLQGTGVTMDASGNINTTGDIATSGGNITVFGTVDGRDVAADGTKLDGIEAGAEVNDPDTVTNAGSSTDNGVARFDGTTGKVVQDSAFTISDAGILSGTAISTTAGITAGSQLSGASLSVTNNITLGGTVDGRNVAVDGNKLDGIEAGADVTDATNVESAIASGMSGSSGFLSVRPGVSYNGGGTARQIDAGAGISVTNGSGAAGNPTIAAALDAGHYYASGFSSNFTSSLTTVPFDTATTAASFLSLSSGEFTLTADATFQLTASLSANQNGTSTLSSWYALLETDTGTGFSELQYARTGGIVDNAPHDLQSAPLTCVLSLSSGDKFRIRGARASGTATYQWRNLGYCHISIVRVA